MDETVAVVIGAVVSLTAGSLSVDTLVRAWRHRGALRFLDRWDALNRFGGALQVNVFVLMAVAWAVFPVAVWYLLVVLLAAAAAGTVLRWPELVWWADDARSASRRVSAVATLVFAALLVGLLVTVLV